MNFMEAVVNDEKKITENGAIGYATTGKKLLDLNFAVSSMRSWDETRIETEFSKAYFENPVLAVNWLFYARDIRGVGMGERRLFRVCMKWLVANEIEVSKKIFSLIPEYGRWDDLVCLVNSELNNEIISLILKQLNEDIDNMKQNKPISLLCKWLPSVNTSSKKTVALGREIAAKLGLTEKHYRKLLSSLRKYADVIEQKMSAKEWSEIDYNTVPSRANLIYNKAFLRNDEKRRREFLEKLASGDKSVKINAGTLFPSDIVHSYGDNMYCLKNIDETLEQLWNNLPDYVNGNGNTLVIRDGSGSMRNTVSGNVNTTAMDVSTALAIYFSEHSTGYFKDKFITFGGKPQIVDISNCSSLKDKLIQCYNYTDYSNTNIEATFMLILESAVRNNMKQEDLPKNCLIVSDMEFDGATTCGWNEDMTPIFDKLKKRFSDVGYDMPRLIFWNVCSRTNTIPLKENKCGVALVSGFSPAVYNMVLSNKLDPFECLLEQLNNVRYDAVKSALFTS